jgi:HEAT repeat protein
MNDLLDQLADPVRSSQALLAIMMKGEAGARLLAEFLRNSRPSSIPEARLLAVEGLGTLKGAQAFDALAAIACGSLDAIDDPVVRLAEETVQSRAAEALGEFGSPSAREILLKLLRGKPLIGAAEAVAKSWDIRAIPSLIAWLEDDFVAEAAARALERGGRCAFAPLIDALREKHLRFGEETGMSKRRRARILEILADLLRPHETALIEDLLEDPDERVRVNAARAVLEKGIEDQQTHAYQCALRLLDSPSSAIRAASEDLLAAHIERGRALVESEIERREGRGESATEFFPHESTLRILHRIQRNCGLSTSDTGLRRHRALFPSRESQS